MSNILLGISGGIAAYKSCDLISMLRYDGHDIRVIMTDNSKQFITPLTLATLSRHPVIDNMWVERNGTVDHVEVGKWADMFVVYPATANIIGKFANGIADDLLSTIYLALSNAVKKKIVFPAMNTNMYLHPRVIENIRILKQDGVIVSETRDAELACGDTGFGAVLKPKDAMEIIRKS